MLEGFIIRLPLVILLLISIALLVLFVKQDKQNKRSFILDVDKFNLAQTLTDSKQTNGDSNNSYKNNKKKKK
ncbi:MAG: hypothetical protein PHV30_02525 [Candidatus Margulisbacteria bacterium]|nr:hypothetical protein [Candidatus Margulisiibacteriota bacterium]